jgi:hypothetical protein
MPVSGQRYKASIRMNERYSDFGTSEQIAKGDRIMLGDERGGVKKTYAKSMLDVLVDNDIINDVQKQYGEAYWRMKEIAFPMLAIVNNPIYDALVHMPEIESRMEDLSVSEDGAITEIYIILNGKLIPPYQMVLNACCVQVIECMPLVVIQACGENLIRQAFEALERLHPVASREFENRCNKAVAALPEKV